MTIWTRRLLTATGLIVLASPADDAAWHHSLLGVFVTVAGSWLLTFALVREGRKR